MNSSVRNIRRALRPLPALAFPFLGVLVLLLDLHPSRAQEPVRTTNPSIIDSDGDGYRDGPDMVVERANGTLVRMLGEDKNGDGKYDPNGADDLLGTADDEYDPNNPTSHPNTPPESDDTDGDGLSDRLEQKLELDHCDQDTDDDGLSDGEETYGTGRCFRGDWNYRTDPSNPDTDLDGIPDGTELGITEPFPTPILSSLIRGTEVDAIFEFTSYNGVSVSIASYSADADAGLEMTATDPLLPDTNGDGYLDGWQDKNRNGAIEVDGDDEAPGTDDDETDNVLGFRSALGDVCTYQDSARWLWIPEYDVSNTTLHDPPSKTQKLEFYWGSSDASEVEILTSHPGALTFAPTTITRSTTPKIMLEISKNDGSEEHITLQFEASNLSGPIGSLGIPAITVKCTDFYTIPITSLYTPAYHVGMSSIFVITDYMLSFGDIPLDFKCFLDIAFGFNKTGNSFSNLSDVELTAWIDGLPLPRKSETANAIMARSACLNFAIFDPLYSPDLNLDAYFNYYDWHHTPSIVVGSPIFAAEKKALLANLWGETDWEVTLPSFDAHKWTEEAVRNWVPEVKALSSIGVPPEALDRIYTVNSSAQLLLLLFNDEQAPGGIRPSIGLDIVAVPQIPGAHAATVPVSNHLIGGSWIPNKDILLSMKSIQLHYEEDLSILHWFGVKQELLQSLPKTARSSLEGRLYAYLIAHELWHFISGRKDGVGGPYKGLYHVLQLIDDANVRSTASVVAGRWELAVPEHPFVRMADVEACKEVFEARYADYASRHTTIEANMLLGVAERLSLNGHHSGLYVSNNWRSIRNPDPKSTNVYKLRRTLRPIVWEFEIEQLLDHRSAFREALMELNFIK